MQGFTDQRSGCRFPYHLVAHRSKRQPSTGTTRDQSQTLMHRLGRIRACSHHLFILSCCGYLHARPRLTLPIQQRRISISSTLRSTPKLDVPDREGRILTLRTRHRVAGAGRQRVLQLRSDEVEMRKTTAISQPIHDKRKKETHKLTIIKLVPYVPSMTIAFSFPKLLYLHPDVFGMITQSKIRHTKSPIPRTRSKTRWMGVPVSPLA